VSTDGVHAFVLSENLRVHHMPVQEPRHDDSNQLVRTGQLGIRWQRGRTMSLAEYETWMREWDAIVGEDGGIPEFLRHHNRTDPTIASEAAR
jgi:hypothetical protein